MEHLEIERVKDTLAEVRRMAEEHAGWAKHYRKLARKFEAILRVAEERK